MPQQPDLGYAFGLKPKDAISYFESLGYRITDDWVDTAAAIRGQSFAVSKSGSLDILREIKQGLIDALDKGETQAQFVKRMEQVLKAKGWDSADPWRLRTIFRTNMRSALMAGRWKQVQKVRNTRSYLQYVAILDARTRPSHAAMNGLVFHIDDPIWNTHFPPCGYNCRCTVRSLSESALKRRGLHVTNTSRSDRFSETVTLKDGRQLPVEGYLTPLQPRRVATRDSAPGEYPKVEAGDVLLWHPSLDPKWAPGEGAPWKVEARRVPMRTDPGFGFNQGEAARWDVAGALPDALPDAATTAAVAEVVRMLSGQKTWKDFDRPDLRSVPDADRIPAPELLPRAPSRDEALQLLAQTLGVSDEIPTRVVQTPVEPVIIDYAKLPHLVEKQRDARERYGLYLLATLETPFEVYLTEYADGFRSRYIGLFQGDANLLVVARINQDGTVLWNIMQADDKSLNKQRVGQLIYTQE